MKMRNGHVTNSSSSSFILGFKDEDSIAKTLAYDNTYGYFETIYHDCLEAEKMDIETMLNNYREYLEDVIPYSLTYRYEKEHRYLTWDEACELRKTDEFKKLCEDEINRLIDELRKNAEGNSIFVKVEYSDDTSAGAELEFEIMPDLDCCLRRISHH